MSYLFTSESVSEGHPDKVADQISDVLLDEFLLMTGTLKLHAKTLVTTGQVVLAGEVKIGKLMWDVQDVRLVESFQVSDTRRVNISSKRIHVASFRRSMSRVGYLSRR